jgi:hypothetical protein
VASCTPAAVGESTEWSTVVSTAKENRASFCKAVSGKTLYSALHGIYTVTLGELKAMLKKSNPAGQKTAPETAGPPSAQEGGFQEVRRRKRLSTGENDGTSKKAVPAPSAALNTAPKEIPTRNFFAPLRMTNMDTDSSGMEAKTQEEAVPEKTCRPPPISLTSSINLIQLQKQLKNVVKDDFEFRSTRNGTRVITNGMADFEAVKSHFTINNLSYYSFFPKS